jgi:hypothetical protein
VRLWNTLFAALVALCVFAPYSLLAQDRLREPSQNPTRSRGAPGPIVGAGLPFLVLAGAYWLARRRASRTNEE